MIMTMDTVRFKKGDRAFLVPDMPPDGPPSGRTPEESVEEVVIDGQYRDARRRGYCYCITNTAHEGWVAQGAQLFADRQKAVDFLEYAAAVKTVANDMTVVRQWFEDTRPQ